MLLLQKAGSFSWKCELKPQGDAIAYLPETLKRPTMPNVDKITEQLELSFLTGGKMILCWWYNKIIHPLPGKIGQYFIQ